MRIERDNGRALFLLGAFFSGLLTITFLFQGSTSFSIAAVICGLITAGFLTGKAYSYIDTHENKIVKYGSLLGRKWKTEISLANFRAVSVSFETNFSNEARTSSLSYVVILVNQYSSPIRKVGNFGNLNYRVDVFIKDMAGAMTLADQLAKMLGLPMEHHPDLHQFIAKKKKQGF